MRQQLVDLDPGLLMERNVAVNLNALRTLAVVMDLGSFSEAGKVLGYTQSAVSQQIGSLERSLGLQLFERRARAIHPTEAARYVYARSEGLVGLVVQLEQDIARLSAGQAGRIRIGFFISAGPRLLPNALAQFMIRRRDVQVTLHEGDPEETLLMMLRGELDVAIVFRYDGIPAKWPTGIRVQPLMTDPMLVIASRTHRFAGREAVALADLAEERWISTTTGTDGHESLVRTTAQSGYQPNCILTANDFDAIQGFVKTSLGVAMIPKLAYVPNADMITLPVPGLPQRHIAAVTRSIEPTPLIASFIAAIRDTSVETSGGA